MEDTRWEMPPSLLTGLGSTPYNKGYTVGNASTPPNRTRVHTLQCNTQWHRVVGGFVIVYSVLGSVTERILGLGLHHDTNIPLVMEGMFC